jgi:hypothetical protein
VRSSSVAAQDLDAPGAEEPFEQKGEIGKQTNLDAKMEPTNATATTNMKVWVLGSQVLRSTMRIHRGSYWEIVVGLNPLMGVDRQHESWEGWSLYPSALQLTRALRLEFIGHATWPIPDQEGVWYSSASFLYK